MGGGGAVLDGVVRPELTFTFFATGFFNNFAFHFFMAA
jgi:hypothetical protein